MSGNGRRCRPVYRPRAQVPGWWCCGRLMVAGDLPGIGEIRLCRRCGAVIRVQANRLLETISVGTPRRRRRSTIDAH